MAKVKKQGQKKTAMPRSTATAKKATPRIKYGSGTKRGPVG